MVFNLVVGIIVPMPVDACSDVVNVRIVDPITVDDDSVVGILVP